MTENTKPVAVILGGTSPHVGLIENLKARGYHTILVDYLENPPARPHADQHIQKSTLDLDLVLGIARDVNAALVIATSVDQANVTACYVSGKLGLPHPYSYDVATVIANKAQMKQRFLENNLPTARYVFVDHADAPDIGDLNYPLVVKPADSNGSAGVRRVNDAAELNKYLGLALEISRVKQAVVEEFITGPELSIDCFVEQGQAKIVLVRKKFAVPTTAGVDPVLQSTGSIAPFDLGVDQQAHIQEVLTRLAKAFDLDNTPMLVQAFMTDTGLSLIEFAARLSGGTGAATTKLISGFDTLDASIDSYLGIPVTVKVNTPDIYSMTNTIYANPGELGRIEGVDALIADGIITQMLHYRTPGMMIGNDMSTRSRVGAFIVTGPDMDTVIRRVREAVERLNVYDSKGNKIMRKDIFSQLH